MAIGMHSHPSRSRADRHSFSKLQRHISSDYGTLPGWNRFRGHDNRCEETDNRVAEETSFGDSGFPSDFSLCECGRVEVPRGRTFGTRFVPLKRSDSPLRGDAPPGAIRCDRAYRYLVANSIECGREHAANCQCCSRPSTSNHRDLVRPCTLLVGLSRIHCNSDSSIRTLL